MNEEHIPQAKRDYRPGRLTIELPESVYNRMVEIIPWGSRAKFITAVLVDVVEFLEKTGQTRLVIGGVMSGELRVSDIIRRASDGDNR